MINFDIIIWLMLILIIIFIYYNIDKIISFFGLNSHLGLKDETKICPKCGSKDWKFPNPLKASTSMINIPSMVNNLNQCKKCDYVGVFFIVDKGEEIREPKRISIMRHFLSTDNLKEVKKRNLFSILILVLVLGYFFLPILITIMIFGIIVKSSTHHKKKKK
jgi:hypothetical protein